MTPGRRRRRRRQDPPIRIVGDTDLPSWVMNPLMKALMAEEVKLAQAFRLIGDWKLEDFGLEVDLVAHQRKARLMAVGQKALNVWWHNVQARRRMAWLQSIKKEGE